MELEWSTVLVFKFSVDAVKGKDLDGVGNERTVKSYVMCRV